MRKDHNVECRQILRLVLVLVTMVCVLWGCSGESVEQPPVEEVVTSDNDENQSMKQDADGYTPGILDGIWELSWKVTEEHFSTLDIEHSLEENRLKVSFDTVDEGHGTFASATWDEEEFTGEWRPYPQSTPNESYRLNWMRFVDNSEDRLEGLASGLLFEDRPVVMQRVSN